MELGVFLLLLLTVFTALLLLTKDHPKTHGCLPPGPRPLPFLGNLLQMDRNSLLKSFLKMRKQYGDVFTLYLGPRRVVILCGTEAIREALVDQGDAFCGGSLTAVMDPVYQEYGSIFGNYPRWKNMRKFILATMRDVGMGIQGTEKRIQEEAQCLVEELRKINGSLQDPTFLFQSISANIICSFIFGKRFSYQDPEFLRLLGLILQVFEDLSSFSSQMYEFFSGFLKYFPGSHRQVIKNMHEIIAFISRSVEDHHETLDYTAPRDFIDNFLIRIDKEKSDPNTDFHQKQLLITAFSLFFAGTETTSTTLRSAFLLMLKYPHVAEKVQKEIDQVIGSHRAPTFNDRTSMPYTDAVIHEIQRFVDLAPIGVPHKVTKDTHFRGYMIPKGTEVFPILSTALHDPHYFKNPETFNPEHFLDANGALKKSEAFMPFLIGKRICLGEGMARMELFLFITNILQNFTLATTKDPKDVDITSMKSGMSRIPPLYKIRFLPRHE
ncbi:cytochrome P450 2B11-like isoform X4 [Suncus etruscus]|uniref:cytochrome P450 2B11-like isoform X4 n=1 Tax=Suncus etruscus TaxID=109475 RepID=UPI0021103C35|nr:cytochrome P450 2B11-like isoform X4 [Suncus etruscus]